MGERTLQAYPNLVYSVRANRAFLARAVRFLAGEAGIRQFLDIGTGIPTANNTHEAAQRVAPSSRIVYVDHDPVVLSHAQALVAARRRGRAPISTPICGTRRPSWPRRRTRWTSASRSRSC
jgi:S-adenosyl methyltransferase